MSVKIIIDSTVDTTPEIRAHCAVVPLTVRFGDEEYIDGLTITHQEFYEKLVSDDYLPTTSQPTPDAFARVYQQIVDDGDTGVVLTISSRLSGTCQSASIAAMDFPGKIFVVDTQTATIGAGILAELAVQLAQQGNTAEKIAEILTHQRENVRIAAVVDTLEYLKRGGRISRTVAFAGELLSIKPLITISEGAIQMKGKARGARQINSAMDNLVASFGTVDRDKPILLGYTGSDHAQMDSYIQNSTYGWTAPATIIGSVIGTHAGPGAFAAAFFVK